MEPFNKTRKMIGKLLLWLLLSLTVWSAYAQFSSPYTQILSGASQGEVKLTVLTTPAMFVSYNPQTNKAVIQILSEKRNQKDPVERVKKLLENEKLSTKNLRYFIPKLADQEFFWEHFKYRLAAWRYNPLLAARLIWDYLGARHDRRTNLTPAEFVLLSMKLSLLEANDFTVKALPRTKKRRTTKNTITDTISYPMQDVGTASAKDRPIIVEIMNASGKRGLASELTQYLRDQNEKGQLRVDVLQYDNYPSIEETSWLEDYSGRLMQVKQLSQALGIHTEIKAGAPGGAICDTRIVIGKDFKMPL
jgi:hypothetical protein